MTYSIISHRLHGEELHNDSIFMLERIICKAGYELIDSVKAFKDLAIKPAEPDIMFRVREKQINSHGKKVKDAYQTYVIEVETNPSSASIATKIDQYNKNCKGIRLIIINLKQCSNTDSRKVLEEFLSAYVP